MSSGITENEIIEEFGSLDALELSLISVSMVVEYDLASNSTSIESGPSVLDCAARAFVGLELHEGFWGSFTNRRALLRAVGRLATRTLGFVGAALIVYDFADCMWG